MSELAQGVAEITDSFQVYRNLRFQADMNVAIWVDDVCARDWIEPTTQARADRAEAFRQGLRYLNTIQRAQNAEHQQPPKQLEGEQ